MEHSSTHPKQGNERAVDDVDARDLEEKNEASGASREEGRNVRKAGGGAKGESLGGAQVGRYGPAPAKVASDREEKPRGHDKPE
jgi:hypothetical protein